MKNKKTGVLNLSLSAVFAAIIFLATMIHISVGVNGAYIHLGDCIIYLAASFLPAPYAISAAAIGAGLADVASGVPVWVPATIIIKSLSALMFTSNSKTILCTGNFIALALSCIFCCVGYYFAEVVIYSCRFIVPLASAAFNLIQCAASAVLYISLSILFDRAQMKERISKL